ncbi:magnesium protoporphyrin IX methyltransferase [Fertoebacter nigrum]|uniref:Magnesium protoporphyrin IX methyltransferase n=1 Tax=Fertoeibacter niger TaxID=2656921 RepID=A0A8X8GZV8_9RHOB|nr:magnesium protoporphyrin IX methyltransferase [Fertoeibacter niger]NUB43589.1 magnesium protoporphyrin IX methyltransferase [Fertoeibacter niger]
MTDYSTTRDRVETYFDRTATTVWERLTSDAPVSRIRQTVRAGRDRMRALMLSRLPADLRGCRVLDAGCGAGQMTAELAARGADVLAVDISPALVEIAARRLPEADRARVTFASGDMLSAAHGGFDFVLAMDSLIYYTTPDIVAALETLGARSRAAVVFTVAPRTPFLMTFFTLGKAFPRADRSPVMIPQAHVALTRATHGRVAKIDRVTSGFYISECLEYRP